jgi:hypothetical protein
LKKSDSMGELNFVEALVCSSKNHMGIAAPTRFPTGILPGVVMRYWSAKYRLR